MTVLALLASCTSTDPVSPHDSADAVVTDVALSWTTAPDPLVAEEPGVFTIEVTDQDGRPIDDLQENHERMIHTMFVSADWTTFVHTHHEDFAALTAADLASATFHFPLTLPLGGRYLVLFDYARENEWLIEHDFLDVAGTPSMLPAPDTTPVAIAELDGMVAALTWSIAPRAGYEATWTVHVTDTDGTPVDDLVPVLGADAHCALVNEELSWGSHTHAWFPDMDRMSPSMDMPHLYDGPDLPFVYTFPAAGAYRMWVQFVRASEPETILVAPFTFRVDG
jgi:hypothetical protein